MVSHTLSCTLSAAVDNNRALSWKRKGSAEWIVGGGIVRCYDMLHSLAGFMQTVEEEGRNHLKNPSFWVLMENWSYFLKVFHSTKALKCHSEKFKLTCRNRSQDHVKASGIWHQWCLSLILFYSEDLEKEHKRDSKSSVYFDCTDNF